MVVDVLDVGVIGLHSHHKLAFRPYAPQHYVCEWSYSCAWFCVVVYMYVLLCVCGLGKFTRWVKSLFIRTNQCHIALKLHLIWVQCSSTPYNL